MFSFGWHLALSLTLLFNLASCASKSYVVLLPDDTGAVGKVVVTTAQGTTLLSHANEGALVGADAGKTFPVDPQRLAKDFGAALDASPKSPRSFMLHFESGGATLTEDSRKEISVITAEIKRRPGADISVIGHTDTTGDAEANFQLGLKRAEIVANLLDETGIARDRMAVESHGEKNLLIRTSDNIDEPRNRRVEVTVR
jgi:outer membrane protein OmpA-like peptidoglycan-associated protein